VVDADGNTSCRSSVTYQTINMIDSGLSGTLTLTDCSMAIET